MPTNLPPDYFAFEKRFRSAETLDEKIDALQEMISVVPKHKGTDHLRADLRRRLARLKEESLSHKGGGKHDSAFRIPKAGAGQVIVVGPGQVGKSSLVAALTEAERVESTMQQRTWVPVPVMMSFQYIHLQLVDTPPLDKDFAEPGLKELIRHADLVLLVVDLHQDPIQQLKDSLALLEEYHIAPLDRQQSYRQEQRMTYLPFLVLVNKCDDQPAEELYQIFCDLLDEKWSCNPVSAFTGRNLEHLKQEMVEKLDLIRVYTKAPGKEPDFTRPFAMKKGSTVEDLAGRIHKDFLEKMKSARVWGKAVYDRQLVQRDYLLQDGDIVEIHI